MKLGGRQISERNIETVVIPRGSGEDIVFRAQAVLDFDEFDTICKRPKPKIKLLRGNKKQEDINAPDYQQALEHYAKQRISWIVLKSLEATPDLEWDTVSLQDPSTWQKFEDELKASGFSIPEIGRIINTCMQANCLDDEKLDKAREDFLASLLEVPDPSSSQTGVPLSILSGDRVSG